MANHRNRVTLICETCHQSFEVPVCRLKHSARFCSRVCRDHANKGEQGNRRKRVQKVCKNCSQPFEVALTYSLRKNGAQFCSVPCWRQYKADNHVPNRTLVTLICPRCKNTFTAPPQEATRRKYCSIGCHVSSQKFNRTSIEIAFAEELKNRKVRFKEQHPIGRWTIDIAFPKYKVAVECDGDYWHNRANSQLRDKRKDAFLEKRGWTVFRFWEHEIHADVKRCVDIVLDYLP